MPTRRVHLKFDKYLKEHGVIYGYTYANIVHDRMDRDLKNMGIGLIEKLTTIIMKWASGNGYRNGNTLHIKKP